MADSVDISYIVPVYNAMPYLRTCVESLVGQTIAPERLELIFVDDGSTDDGGAYLDEVARDHPNMRVVHTEASGGPGTPRNRGLAQATGEYVFFCDADDYMEPDASEAMLEAARAWGSDVLLVRPKGEGGRNLPKAFGQTLPKADIYESDVFLALGPCKLFRRAFLNQYRLDFDTDLPVWEDQCFVARAYLLARTVSVAADRYYAHWVLRDDDGNESAKRETIPFESILRYLSSMMGVVDELADLKRAQKVMIPRVLREGLYYAGKALAREPREKQRPQFEKLRHAVLPYATDSCLRLFNLQRTVALRALQADDLASWLDILSTDSRGFLDRFADGWAVEDGPRTVRFVWRGDGATYTVDGRGHLALRPLVEALSWEANELVVMGTLDRGAAYGAVGGRAIVTQRDGIASWEASLQMDKVSDANPRVRWQFSVSLADIAARPDVRFWDFSVELSYENGRTHANRLKTTELPAGLNRLHAAIAAPAPAADATPAAATPTATERPAVSDAGDAPAPIAVFAYATKKSAFSLCNPLIGACFHVRRQGVHTVGSLAGIPKRAATLLGTVTLQFDFGGAPKRMEFPAHGEHALGLAFKKPRGVDVIVRHGRDELPLPLPLQNEA